MVMSGVGPTEGGLPRSNENRIEVIGVAHPEATVKVNGDAGTYRRGEYFRKEVAVANNSYPTISVTAEHGGLTGSKDGEIFIPPATEDFDYDSDGNVLFDGRWQYTWDGENQLVAMESFSNAPSGSHRRLEFDYDHLGRRIAKRVYDNGSATPSVNRKFIYDGWNLIAELNETDNSFIRAYIWGSDLSGSLQDAGGTGGLVAVVDAWKAHFVVMDGSGNVVGLVDSSTGLRSATYEYDPSDNLFARRARRPT